jgi:hypothetical protein
MVPALLIRGNYVQVARQAQSSVSPGPDGGKQVPTLLRDGYSGGMYSISLQVGFNILDDFGILVPTQGRKGDKISEQFLGFSE